MVAIATTIEPAMIPISFQFFGIIFIACTLPVYPST